MLLLTGFVGPAQPSSTSITSRCGLTVEGEFKQSLMLQTPIYKSLMLTKVGQREISIQGDGSCNLTLLVVGGGGYGGRGGGGSGYLEYRSLQVSAGSLMTYQVGDQEQSSSLTISGFVSIKTEPGEVFQLSGGSLMTANVSNHGQSSSLTFSSGVSITAEPGQNGQSRAGGNGYSGGGAGGRGSSSGGVGGSNGGNGERGPNGSGGSGTGQDVSIFTFTNWSLGPGAGGQHSGYNFGGGGGGMMVNGAGPQGNNQGAGFGGGGRGYSDHGDGFHGVILVEIQ